MLNNPWGSAFVVLMLGVIYTLFAIFYKKGGNERLLNYTPNVWTALGILGTFMTLFFTLKDDLPMEFTRVNGILIKSENIDIKELINQLTSAFSTSIVGILGAGISSIFIKVNIDKLEKENKHKYIKEIWYDMPFEQILYKTFKLQEESSLILSKSLQLQKTSNLRLSKLLKLQEASNLRLYKSLEQINTTLNFKLTTLSTVYAAGINSLNDNSNKIFQNIINIETPNDEKTVIGLLKKLNSDEHKPTIKLAESIGKMDTSLNKVSTSINSLMEDFKNKLTEFTEQIKATTNTTISELNKEAIKKAQQNAEKASKEFTDAIQKIIKSNEALIVSQNQNTSTTLNNNNTKLQEIHKSVTDLLTAQKDTFNTQIEGITKKVEDNAHEMNKKFTEVLGKIQTSLNSLSATMLTQTQTQLDAQLKLVKSSISENVKALSKATKLAESVQNSATTTLEVTTKEFAKSISSYLKAKNENENVAEQLQNQLIELKELLQEQVTSRESMNNIISSIREYDDEINDIKNTVNELGEIKSSLKQLTTKL